MTREDDDVSLESLLGQESEEKEPEPESNEPIEKEDIDIPEKEEQENKEEKTDDILNFEIEEEKTPEPEEEYKVPEKFETPEEELKFYKENFGKLKEEKLNPEVLATKYEDVLLEKEKSVEELKALRDMLNGSPDTYVKIRFKDQLAKNGYDYRITEEEAKNLIHNKLSETFGHNYSSIYDPDDTVNENSFSYKMLKMQEDILKEIDTFNQRTENGIPENQQPQYNEEEAIKTVKEELSKAGVKDGNIERFIKDLKTEAKELLNNPVRMYKALYMDKIIEKKIAQAKEEGRKEALKEFKNATSEE